MYSEKCNGKKYRLADYLLSGSCVYQFVNNFPALLLCKLNFLNIFDMCDFIQIFVISQSTEMLMKLTLWLGMHMPYVLDRMSRLSNLNFCFTFCFFIQIVQSSAIADLRSLPQEGKSHHVLQVLPSGHVRMPDGALLLWIIRGVCPRMSATRHTVASLAKINTVSYSLGLSDGTVKLSATSSLTSSRSSRSCHDYHNFRYPRWTHRHHLHFHLHHHLHHRGAYGKLEIPRRTCNASRVTYV